MQTNVLQLSDLFNGTRQLEIPFYQRSYVWGPKEWKQFLASMEEVSNRETAYFFGSLVLKCGPQPNKDEVAASKRYVIDGQQRLTTLVVFFKVLCLKTKELKAFERVFLLEDDSPTLLQGHSDGEPFMQVLNMKSAKRITNPTSKIARLYNYFIDNVDESLFNRSTIQKYLTFDCLEVGYEDDEQQIFNSINAVGVQMSPTDLLKNYFFSREDLDDYTKYWRDVFETSAEDKEYWEQSLTSGGLRRDFLDLFFSSLLIIQSEHTKYDIPTKQKDRFSRPRNLFGSYKEFIEQHAKNKLDVLEEVRSYAPLFRASIDPHYLETPIDPHVGIERINLVIFGLNAQMLIPYVLYLLKNAPADDLDRILRWLEVHYVRRLITKETRAGYKRLISRLIHEEVFTYRRLMQFIASSNESVVYIPTDEAVRASFIASRFGNQQMKAIIYLIETSIRPLHSSTALLGLKQYSLEHLMPRNWKAHWKDDETIDEELRNQLIGCMGNVAIIRAKLNTSISNSEWPKKLKGSKKRPGLKKCGIGLATMTQVVRSRRWDEGKILERAEWLAEKAVRVWERGGPEQTLF